VTTLATMTADIQSYTTVDSTEFVAEIPRFIQAAEERVWYFVQLPNFKRAVTGNVTSGNQYLALPTDFLASASLAIILPNGDYVYLLNKDVSWIREVYPNPSTTAQPYAYALFNADDANTNIIMGPTPDQSYSSEMNYFYKPTSLVTDTAGTWLSQNAYDTLLYGALAESANWLKKIAGIDSMGDEYEKRFLVGLQTLKSLGEARDRKDVYRGGELRSSENP
jgi:hypothetical protein